MSVKVYASPDKEVKLPTFNPKTYHQDEEKYYAALKQWLQGKGYNEPETGFILQFPAGDGHALYMVVSTVKPSVLHIKTGDAWEYPIHNFTSKGFRDSVQQQRNLENSRTKHQQQAESKYIQLFKQHGIKPGDIVHDAPKFDRHTFAIRMLVNHDYSLKDIGIVGEVPDNEMPKFHLGGKAPQPFYPYHVGRAHKGESHTWDNRPDDIAELRGDTSWSNKPINEAAMTPLIITPEVTNMHNNVNVIQDCLNAYQHKGMSIEEVKLMINNLK